MLCASVWRKLTSHHKKTHNHMFFYQAKTDFLWGEPAALQAEWSISGCCCCRRITEWVERLFLRIVNWVSTQRSLYVVGQSTESHPPDILRRQQECDGVWAGVYLAKFQQRTPSFRAAHGESEQAGHCHYRHRAAARPQSWRKLQRGWIRALDSTSSSITAGIQWGGVLRERTAAAAD